MRSGQTRLLIAALLVTGCGTPATSANPSPSEAATAAATPTATASALPSPTATASPLSSPIAFASERYGYAVQLPPGWYVREEGAGTWTPQDLNYVGSGTDAFEEDYTGRGTTVADFPGVTFGLYVSSAKVSPGTTLADWMTTLAGTVMVASSCQGKPDQESTTVGGEAAGLLVYERSDCGHDHHVLFVGVLHGGSGFVITWLARRGEENARRTDFEALLRTFHFTR